MLFTRIAGGDATLNILAELCCELLIIPKRGLFMVEVCSDSLIASLSESSSSSSMSVLLLYANVVVIVPTSSLDSSPLNFRVNMNYDNLYLMQDRMSVNV